MVKVGFTIVIAFLLISVIAAGKDNPRSNEQLRQEVVAAVGQLSPSVSEPVGDAAVSTREVLAEVGRFVKGMAQESVTLARYLWDQLPAPSS